jgi:glycosyltransferase involved in cell wall biosynthesis
MVAIVIPAYNEEKNIVRVLESIKALGRYTCIVVDDGSRDATADLARQYAIVLTHVVNRGMGAALATGTLFALLIGATYIVHFDGDGQHQATDIAAVVAPLERGEADIVFGSRYLGAGVNVPWTKRYLLHMPALALQRLMTGLRLTDVHNGFRAMNRHAAETILIRQDRMAHASEIVNEVKRNRLRYTEVPVTIVYQEYGQGFIGGLRILKDLIVKKIL